MKKFFAVLFLVLVLFIGGVVLAKDQIAKAAVEKAVRVLTGLPLKIGGLEVGLLRSRIIVNDLKLGNPASFSDPTMADLPELYVDYDLQALMKKEVHLEELRINLRELDIIKNKDGKLNLDALKPARSGKKQPAAQAPSEKKELPIQIDTLHLRLGKVVYRDYSKGSTPFTQEFALNLDETYHNVNDPKAIVPLIVGKVLMNTTISQLANIDPKELFSKYAMSGTDLGKLGLGSLSAFASALPIDSAGKGAASAGSGVVDTAKKAVDDLKKAFQF